VRRRQQTLNQLPQMLYPACCNQVRCTDRCVPLPAAFASAAATLQLKRRTTERRLLQTLI
jgi:hypothetical protein